MLDKSKAVEALIEDIDYANGWLSDAQDASTKSDSSKIVFEGNGSIDVSHAAGTIAEEIPVSDSLALTRLMEDTSWVGQVHLDDHLEYTETSVEFIGGAVVDVALLVDIAVGS